MEEINIKLPDYITYELLLELVDFGISNAFETKKRDDYRLLKKDLINGTDTKYRN